MYLKAYDELPSTLQNSEVKAYYDSLVKKNNVLVIKRLFDLVFGIIGMIVLLPFMLIIAISIKLDSKGPIVYKQKRITQYGRVFEIYKFRTMVINADKLGSLVTKENDPRITKVGKFLRKYRLDETSQIFNIIKGDLSFVGTRPEVQRYVDAYTNEMYATLLLPAGVTSLASIEFKDEDALLADTSDVDKTYIEEVLPLKMKINLEYLTNFNIFNDIKIIFKTLLIFIR